ncbi:MAG: EF-hand domain-containing protein [Pseudomonadota bacterium]
MLNVSKKTLAAGLVAAAISGTVVVGVAYAAGGDHGRGGHHGRGFGGISFEEVDANGDGTITLQEMQAAAGTRFGNADTNGDGAIDLGEFAAAQELRAEERRQLRAARAFERLDANSDGTVTQEEMETAVAERFERMDRNEDGELTPERPRRN